MRRAEWSRVRRSLESAMSFQTRIGTEVGGYRLLSVIGRGGMSVIYLAEQVRLGRKVALKLLAPELAHDERYRDRFLLESRLAATIEHPNIIQIYDAGQDGGALFIAMRYVNGPSLKELIARPGALGVGRVIYVIDQIASALDAAHAQNLVHRDVKPANILLEEASDHAFLTDFGVAKHTVARGLTSTGLFLGTIEYSAPEQIEGRTVDHRTDVYGLGCVLVESLTSKPPYEQEAEIALMHAHLSAPPPLVTARRPDLPAGLNEVVARALAKDPDDRYQSAGELAAAMHDAARPSRASAPAAVVAPVAADTTVVTAQQPATAAPTASSEAAAPQAPPAAAPPSPPASPAAPATPTGGRRRIPALALVVAAVVLVGVAGAAAGVLLTRGGGGAEAAMSTAMSTGAGHPAPVGTSAMSMDTGDEGTPTQHLATMIAGQTTWRCVAAAAKNGAVRADVCSTKVPGRLTISVFDSPAMLTHAYDSELRRQHGPASGTGTCSDESWRGEGAWVHGVGEPGGRFFCYIDDKTADSHLVWTSTLGVKTLFDATYSSPDHRNLYFWWRNIRHDLA